MRPKGQANAPAHRNNRTLFFPPPFLFRPPLVSPDEEINNVSPGTFSGESIRRGGFRFYSARVTGSYSSRNITAIGDSRTRPPRGIRQRSCELLIPLEST